MHPCSEARTEYPRTELAPQSLPFAVPPGPVFSSPAGCSSQEPQHGAPPNKATNAVMMPPWASMGSSERRFRSAVAAGKNVSPPQIQDYELNWLRHPEFSSQQKTAYMRGDSGFTNQFLATNEKWSSGQSSSYQYCSGIFLDDDEISETKNHHIGSSWRPESLELLQPVPPHIAPNCFYYDAGKPETTSLLPPGNLIQTGVSSTGSRDFSIELLQGMEATEHKEACVLAFPRDKNSIPGSDDNSRPTRKGRIVQDSLLWDSNWTPERHHMKDYHFGRSKSCAQNVSESAVTTTSFPKFFRQEYKAGCHHLASNLYPCSDVKELEKKEWTKLLQKELTNSDVGSLGRIVLPKKEAEANLPPLLEKDGLVLEMVDMSNHVVWGFKYRFWPNNRSRMYILENTGDFAKMNKLEIGDSLVIYGDRASRCYLVGVEKKAAREKNTGSGATDQLREDVSSKS